MNTCCKPHLNTFVKNLRRSASAYGLSALAILSLSGCGDFFATKPTEIETREILNELSQVRENPNITNTLPDLYRTPPKRVATKEGVKLFYFTKHHSADNLAKLVKDQFCTKPVGDVGKRTAIPGYDVSPSAATNQLIVQCPNDAETDKVLNFLENVHGSKHRFPLYNHAAFQIQHVLSPQLQNHMLLYPCLHHSHLEM